MIKLICGDCLEKMHEIESGSIDMVLTDPPYGIIACKWDQVIPFTPMWTELKRIIKPNGAILLFGSEPFSSHLRLSNLEMFKYDWIWVKNQPTGHLNAKRMPMRNNESISVFYKNQPTYNRIKQLSQVSQETIKRYNYKFKASIPKHSVYGKEKSGKPEKYQSRLVVPRNTLFFKGVGFNSKERIHPTQKPVILMEYLIKTYTNRSEIILDFAMGSGTTGVACLNLERDFIGIEIDQKEKEKREMLGTFGFLNALLFVLINNLSRSGSRVGKISWFGVVISTMIIVIEIIKRV